ncbi:universal stress protein [Mesonia sp. MT50]|uniref:Universal stress protein n=1 Tax=Mesonia profundi TaxID=3070998 RepID=A0ABU0ZYE6_9FLAO|nr:universal stress protein [Mesonia profundi]MDQ7916487.1 universal stress protein [Mesonia profundi]
MSTFQKILVATDFSDSASAVYDFTEEIAKNFEATIDLVHILKEPKYFSVDVHTTSLPIDESTKKKYRNSIKEKMETELKDNIPEKYRGKTILKTGKPADEIKACAIEGNYDLIMIASRGEGHSIFNKGSVTEKLMRISRTPVWSILKDSATNLKTIIVPTDGSDVSLEALPLAYSLAVKRNAKIELLSVSKTNFINPMMGEFKPYVQKDEAIKGYILKGLQEYIKQGTSKLQFKEEPKSANEPFQLEDKNGNTVDISIVVKKGDSAHLAVVEYAEKNGQLVVMATHGHSKLARMFVGSTTANVFRNLKIPVMTIKPDFVK